VYRKLRPTASEQRLVWVGRLSTAVLVVFGLLWIPLMKLISGQLYQYLQSVQAYIAPPIAAVFLIGLLSARINSRGATAALGVGFVLGMGRLIAELNKSALDGVLLGYASINFLHFAAILFVVCSAVLVLVSLSAPAPARAQVEGLTFQTTERGPRVPAGAEAWLSGVLVLAVLVLWWYFSG
jgi:SSS family solute:Na+ symporter